MKKSLFKRAMSTMLASAMVFGTLGQSAFAIGTPAKIVKGTAAVEYGYDVQAEVTVTDGKIEDVNLTYDEPDDSYSKECADKAVKGMKSKFIGLSETDKAAIEGVDAVATATFTSNAYKEAVINALGLDQSADFTFGSHSKELKPGVYTVPISLRHYIKHDKPSAAETAFPAMGRLTVAEDGSAVLETRLQSVQKGPIVDMAYDVKVYQGDSIEASLKDVDILETMTNPEGIFRPNPDEDKVVPSKISFKVPNNHMDGVYMSLWVDAMNSAPDAWLEIRYDEAKVPGEAEVVEGSAKVNQFGKYTMHTKITVMDGVISDVDIYADNFISETHKPTNEAKIAQVKEALKSTWNGIAPTQDNAELIFKKIMKTDAPDEVIDAVSGATYSAKAVRDSIMSAFNLEYQEEVINVPESVEPGIYEVEAGYYSDVVWHSLVENTKTKAILTVNKDKTMSLDLELKSGTDKEPLYVLGFNGVYPNNDRSQALTKDGTTFEMGLSANDYEDQFFAKGTQVVNHVTFPLLGGLNKVYNTNCYLYVPAMNKLNGDLSGVHFENGHFNVDIFAKIYWDGMKKIGEAPEIKPEVPSLEEGKYTASITMMHEAKDQPSMCDPMFDMKADIEIKGEEATLKLFVANPIPGFPEQGADGTVKDVKITYNGKSYPVESQLGTDAKMTAKVTNQLFGFTKDEKYPAQVLTVKLPKEAIQEGAMLKTDAFVNVVMMSNQTFRVNLTNIEKAAAEDPVKDFVARLYTEVLGRDADPEGLNSWTDVLKSQKETGAKVAMGFVDSAEFKSKNVSDEEFVKIMYRTFLGRNADEGGLKGWLKVLDEGLSRLSVFRGFVESPEFTEICDSYGIIRGKAELNAPMDQPENEKITKFVARCYKVFLGRKADADGINGWVTALVSGKNNAKQAAHGFVMSPEFQGKNLSNEDYVKTMYIGLMNRESDPAGLASWVKVLENGGSREEIFYGFADSLEFRDLARSYNLSGDWKAN